MSTIYLTLFLSGIAIYLLFSNSKKIKVDSNLLIISILSICIFGFIKKLFFPENSIFFNDTNPITIMDRNILSFIVLTFSFLYLNETRANIKPKIFLIIVVSFWVIFLGSRSALLYLMFIGAFFWFKQKGFLIKFLPIIFLIILGLIFFPSSDRYESTINLITFSSDNFNQIIQLDLTSLASIQQEGEEYPRIMVLIQGVQLLYDNFPHPVGIGFHNLEHALIQNAPFLEESIKRPHNSILTMLLEYGFLITIILFVAMVGNEIVNKNFKNLVFTLFFIMPYLFFHELIYNLHFWLLFALILNRKKLEIT